jgi:hypothetical protein
MTGLGFGVHRIEAGELRAAAGLSHDPDFLAFPLGGDGIDQRRGDHHGAVIVDHDEVVRERRDATAADRLAPADEDQLRRI